MKIDFNCLKIGDRLVRTKGGLFTKHHAIYAGFHNRQHIIAENQTGKGVQYITLKQFLSEGKLERIDYLNNNLINQNNIIQDINQKIGTNYSLIEYNCEHFANEIITGKAKSSQVQKAIIIGIGLGFFSMYKLLRKK